MNSNSIVVAATNLVDLLDQALFRRFDVVLNYALPSEPMVRDLILNRLGPFATPGIDWTAVSEAAKGLSHAEIVRSAEEAVKDAILAEESTVQSEVLVNELMARKDIRTKGL